MNNLINEERKLSIKKTVFTALWISLLGLTACSEQQVNEWACGHKMGQTRCLNLAEKAYNNKDYEKFKKYLEISSNYGNAQAQAHLGVFYQQTDEKIGEKDYQKALYWLQKSAEQGNKYGQSALGDMYAFAWGVEQDDTQAVTWYQKAAEQNEKEAQYHLGYMYAKGKGVEKNLTKAKEYYTKACNSELKKQKVCENLDNLAKEI